MRTGSRAMWALVVAGAIGCTGGGRDEQADPAAEVAAVPEGGAAQPDAAAPATRLSDAEIAAIVVAANGIDVRYGELARQRAVDERVKEFAETMIAAHTAVNDSAAALVGRLGVTPRPNEVSASLESAAAEKRAELSVTSGAAFDVAYIGNEVAYHRAVLDALDTLLIPNAANEELRSTLIGVRPAFEAHLLHAENLQRTLDAS